MKWATLVTVCVAGSVFAGDLNRQVLGRWHFDEDGGTTSADESSHALTAELHNGATWVPGVLGSGISLDGVDDYVSMNGLVLPSGVSDMSAFIWVKSTDVHDTQARIMGRNITDPTPNGYLWFNFGKGGPGLEGVDQSATSWTVYASQVNVADGQWHLLGFTLDRSAAVVRVYADAQLVASFNPGSTGAFGSASATGEFHLGGQDPLGSSVNLKAQLDELVVYGRVLETDELTALYAQGGFGERRLLFVGCGCQSGGEGPMAGLMMLALLVRRRARA